ncbi:GGDEF domain-containing protein, partial [Vibrio parahaemolyticus]|nr:GGDEF domain-containing protein [Vibrio parahaemolyticus]
MTDEFKKSTANLKKAVPLMIKNHVAATPANYALWYTYVDKTIPELNFELDTVLENYGICPPATNKQLYNNYVASKAETSLEDLRTNVEVLLHEVSSSMSDTISDTSS